MSYTCEEGTDVYDVYEGHWQVGKASNVPNTYTIFEKFKNKAALTHHGDHIEGTAIYTWRTHRNDYIVGDITVTQPSTDEFEDLLMQARREKKEIVRPAQKALTDAICEHYSVYNLVTFTINFRMRDEFLKWIKPLAKKSFVCEEGTDVYDVYKGHWQVKKTDPGVADPKNDAYAQFTYTIFEKFKNQAALEYHAPRCTICTGVPCPGVPCIEGTAIYTWRNERNDFASTAPKFCPPGRPPVIVNGVETVPPCKLKLKVTHPTGKEFNDLKKIVDEPGPSIRVFENALRHDVGDTQCKAYKK